MVLQMQAIHAFAQVRFDVGITVLSLVLAPLNELHFQGINYLLWGINSCKHNYTNGFQYKNIFWSLKPKGILESEIRFNCCTTSRGIKSLFCFFLCLVWQFAGFFYLKVSYCETMCSYTYLLICKSNCMMAFLLLILTLLVCKIGLYL